MRTLDELLRATPALQGLSPTQHETVAGCARNRVFTAGERLLHEGDRADVFFVLRHGAVALETAVPGRGHVTVQTLHDGDLLGWSWLVPPYRTAFDARALETTHVVELDGACLRGKCDTDPELGYALLKAVATVFAGRLQDARLRLLDLYGTAAGA
ncbi:MAG: cyclic nucleotide-binding domain-containing protein [Solirubrobacteraceae bacterium]